MKWPRLLCKSFCFSFFHKQPYHVHWASHSCLCGWRHWWTSQNHLGSFWALFIPQVAGTCNFFLFWKIFQGSLDTFVDNKLPGDFVPIGMNHQAWLAGAEAWNLQLSCLGRMILQLNLHSRFQGKPWNAVSNFPTLLSHIPSPWLTLNFHSNTFCCCCFTFWGTLPQTVYF
jgi:hypothetical protein